MSSKTRRLRVTCKACGKEFERAVSGGTGYSQFAENAPAMREFAVLCPFCKEVNRVVVKEQNDEQP